MGVIGGNLGYHILRRLAPGGVGAAFNGDGCANGSKLERVFGPLVWDHTAGKTVIDLGCGAGKEAVQLAVRGAERVIGIDIREHVLNAARDLAQRHSVSDRCHFTTHTSERGDALVCLDAFEHFADPGGMLTRIAELLRPGGRAFVAFGPPWLHPYGGHLFSVFPWAHLLFTERALIRWRSDFKSDGASRFDEVEGGLNQMTVSRFEALIRSGPMRIASFETIPIRRLEHLSNSLTRELLTSLVKCTLVNDESTDSGAGAETKR
jgi:SAM-dependent methyltransferase